jgi:hypothetical protein
MTRIHPRRLQVGRLRVVPIETISTILFGREKIVWNTTLRSCPGTRQVGADPISFITHRHIDVDRSLNISARVYVVDDVNVMD